MTGSAPASLGTLFDRAATAYDAERPALVPCFDAFYGAALAALGDLPRGARVLDLGAGTGLLSGLLRAAWPDVRLVLCDLAPAMLDAARERFRALPGPAPDFVTADYARDMPAGPFDAIVSALSIHHLPDPDKARVAAMVRARLRPGGVFVNAEQVAGETPAEEARLDRDWEAAARARGASPGTIAAARKRMAHDRCVSVEANRALMADAGFLDVDATFHAGRFAVLAGRAPE